MLWTAIAQTQRIDRGFAWACQASPQMTSQGRSEEHTSELQSQSNLVCRLLLEKKKQTVEVDVLRELVILTAGNDDDRDPYGCHRCGLERLQQIDVNSDMVPVRSQRILIGNDEH